MGEEKERYVDYFVTTLMKTNRTHDWFINFLGVENLLDRKPLFDAMSPLIRAENSKYIFFQLLRQRPDIVTIFPILIGISKVERGAIANGADALVYEPEGYYKYDFSMPRTYFTEEQIWGYYQFYQRTGLEYLFMNMLGFSVYDYAIGVLSGLDSNGRKNRTGTGFEALCETQIRRASEPRFKVDTQVDSGKFADFSELRDVQKDRTFDFVLSNGNRHINIEVNFYNSGGSKPDAIIGDYINRRNMLARIGWDFILITDGQSWSKPPAIRQLEIAYSNFPFMNYTMLCEGFLAELLSRY